jgi:hypothetical protein
MVEDYSLYADEEELYENEEGEAVEEEGSNRAFMILAGSLGGLLLVAVCIFAVWAFVINPRLTDRIASENHDIEATNEVVALTATAGALAEAASLEGTATATPVPEEAADTPAPTHTPRPTDTPRPPATLAPGATTPPGEGTEEATPAEATRAATPAAVAAADTATPRPTAISQTSPTPISGKSGVPETGLGAVGASVLAVGLLFMLIMVRRLRHAA